MNGALLAAFRYPQYPRSALPKDKIDEVRWVSKHNGLSLLADTDSATELAGERPGLGGSEASVSPSGTWFIPANGVLDMESSQQKDRVVP